MFFYALFPFIIRPILRLDRNRLAWLLVGAVALSILWPLLLRPEQQDSGVAFWSIYISPLYRLLEFVAGIALAGLLRAGVRTRIPVALAMALVVMAYLEAEVVPMWAGRVAMTIVPFCLLIFVCAQADVSGARTGLRHPWLIRLGQWSFAFYLVHQLILRVVNVNLAGHVTSAGGVLAVTLAEYAVATAAAYLLFTWIEEPWEKRIRRGSSSTPASEWRVLPAASGD